MTARQPLAADGRADTDVAPEPVPDRTGQAHPRRLRRLAATGLLATLGAMAATTALAALAMAVGVDFEVPEGAEPIPLPGFAVVTGFFCLIGVVIAVALLRWSSRPARRFVQTTLTLVAVSLVPPVISGASGSTVASLVVLHLVAAGVLVTTLTRRLRTLSS